MAEHIPLNELDIKKLQNNDTIEWNKFYSQKNRFIKYLEKRHKLSTYDAEDIYGEAVSAVCVNIIEREQTPPNFEAHFATILNNKAIDFFRANKKQIQTIDNPESQEIAENDDFLKNIENQEMIKKALNQLSPHHREIITLEKEGYENEEIAKILNKEKIFPENSNSEPWDKKKVANHKNRAMRRLKEIILNL